MLKTIKILLIEDDEDYRVIIKDFLKEMDFPIEVEEADSSSAGLEKLTNHSYDCVLIDYIIPGISGLDVVKKAKNSGVISPFIILTAYGDEDLGKELIKEGATDYLSRDQLNVEILQHKIQLWSRFS
ncbi:MAG: response regulator [Nitrospinales bacterium]